MRCLTSLGLCMLVALTAGCGPRVTVTTGTTIGLKATPGDGYTRPPQVTFGYKRAELALVPTVGTHATATEDAFSTLAAFYFSTEWFGQTELSSFIGTGHAARRIQQQAGFQEEVAKAAQRFDEFRINNRVQLSAASRITETYRRSVARPITRKAAVTVRALGVSIVPRNSTCA